ncbi:hypothetical protein CROQUDRAFT_447782 [Cronartium quercuum f. sp. fusiforme G11]|uniref:Uncharacterized protein n=1 Tax=Cronartium quercuum f. sp. fusiforme G11 TaxID=708437 RepID=A0A9P6NP47_9BASI|nr:hypothetical protein CROQUDRAFT_447782 [Cronartium quercuum f. sp. fusiforme G11]
MQCATSWSEALVVFNCCCMVYVIYTTLDDQTQAWLKFKVLTSGLSYEPQIIDWAVFRKSCVRFSHVHSAQDESR